MNDKLKSFFCKIGLHSYTKWYPFVSTDRWWKGLMKDCQNCDHYTFKITHRPPPKTVTIHCGINVIDSKPDPEIGPY